MRQRTIHQSDGRHTASTLRRWLARLIAVCAALGLVATVAATPAFASAPRHRHHYYLSIGDSLAFGYQPNLVAEGDTDIADYRSYAEDYARLVPRLHLINYGCPGETTTTFIDGGCPWPAALHDSYGGATSQLAATVAFLEAHHGQVSLVSLDIGSNDLLALVSRCESSDPSDPTACLTAGLPAVLGGMTTHISQILATVHRLAPHARVVLFNLYNPLALAMPSSDQLVATVNSRLAQVAEANGAHVADAFGAINIRAGSWAEKFSLCVLTWECSSYQNVHPTTLGYDALTVALVRAVH